MYIQAAVTQFATAVTQFATAVTQFATDLPLLAPFIILWILGYRGTL
jgi:hypothetical protein